MGTLKEKITGANKERMKTIYLDMDGVVADFDGYVDSILGIKTKPGVRFSQEDWRKIRDYDNRIYLAVEVLPSAKQLVDVVKLLALEYNYNIKFLTAVPKENDLGWAFWDKMTWAGKNFPGIPVWFGPYSKDKAQHYKPGDILIDDRMSNIVDWQEVGGQAILHDHTNCEFTVNTLQQFVKGQQ